MQTGLSRTGVFNICQRHAHGGAKALRDAAGGRQAGEFRILAAGQERQVQQLIRDKTPDQVKLLYALWSRVAVSGLIAYRLGMRIPVRTMGTYLPSYSPELNPDEMANADIKQAVTQLASARTRPQLVKAASHHLRSVQKQPARIRRYFQHDPVKYAA